MSAMGMKAAAVAGGARREHAARREEAPRHGIGDRADADRRRAKGMRRGLGTSWRAGPTSRTSSSPGRAPGSASRAPSGWSASRRARSSAAGRPALRRGQALTEQICKTIDTQRVAGLGLADDIVHPREEGPVPSGGDELGPARRVLLEKARDHAGVRECSRPLSERCSAPELSGLVPVASSPSLDGSRLELAR